MALNLLFTDGFDNCDFDTSPLKYPGASIGFYQGTTIPGINSTAALSIQNTAATTISLPHQFGTQTTVLWCGNVQINAAAFVQQIFLIVGASGAPLLQLEVENDGTLNLLDGAGTVLGSSPALVLDQWYWIEMNAVYGTSGSFEVWLGLAGATPAKVIHGTANLTSTLPDRFTIEWSSPSGYFLRLDNLQVYSAAALSDRNGPAAVTGEIVGALVTAGGWTLGAGTSALQAVADQSVGYASIPDGDLSRIETGPSPALYNPASSRCFGLVLGVAINLVAKPTDPSPTISGIVRERSITTTLGTQTVVDTTNTLVPFKSYLFGYATYQFISMGPAAGGNWNDSQIVTGQWGAAASGDLRVTQVYLEKVTDLTGRKFGCGASSYAF